MAGREGKEEEQRGRGIAVLAAACCPLLGCSPKRTSSTLWQKQQEEDLYCMQVACNTEQSQTSREQ
jgi:hypothetical protein